MLRRLGVAAAVLALVFLIMRASPIPPPTSAALGAIGRGPTVVLVHGLGSDYDDWLPVARDLARDHRVVFVELPGHGLAPMATPFALEQATLALDRAIAEQAHDPVVLVGHSVGGLVATAEALRAPQRVRGLVLVETALAPQVSRAEADTLIAEFDRDWEGTLHAVYSSFGRDSLQGERLWARASQVERQNLRAWIPVALHTDLTSEAAGLAMPVLAVLAPRSWEAEETWEHAAKALGYARIPRLRGVRIENCGHFIMLDRPRRLAEAIRRFSSNVDSAYALR
ncbi:MAG TPA: alpha/beta fold hydrolase [Verrucomicrobiae bacterium]|nr:alpha/beta fold hydrolase [Verrucomicrobiae bacterium]